MNAYIFLQHYWWFVVSLLGALLVFLLFVQGGNSLLFCLGKTEEQKKMMINSTGRKWEFTFTTLVTFGGAFFASFPLFYSTSFGGAYWLWMIILFSFVLQAVSYEFQSKAGNLRRPPYHRPSHRLRAGSLRFETPLRFSDYFCCHRFLKKFWGLFYENRTDNFLPSADEAAKPESLKSVHMGASERAQSPEPEGQHFPPQHHGR